MFITAVRVERDLGVPSVSFNTPTGHRSCTPEDCSELVANSPQGPVPVSGVFPAGSTLHLLETRLQAVWLSPCRADPPARHPIRLGMDCRFSWHAFVPGLPFQGRVSHRIQRHLLSSLPAARAIHQCTSWRTDYYQTSVAIGLASRRRSLVRPCCTYRAERRRPTHLLKCPHWASPAPRRLRRQIRDTDTGHSTGSGVFPVDGGLHHWRFGFGQFSSHHIPRVPQHPAPQRLARPLLSWHALVPQGPFEPEVSHQTQEPPSEFLPAALGIQQGASRRTGSAA
jgi:hypothetical protein